MSTTTDSKPPRAVPPPVEEDLTLGAPITTTKSMQDGAHHYLLCLDPEDTDASHRALAYTKARLAHAGDLVVLFSVLEHSLYFPLEDWGAPGFTSAYSEVADTEAEKALEKQLQDAELARLKKEGEGFAAGVRVQSRVEFSTMGPKIEKIVEACQLYNCEIIIVGRRKRGALSRWLGSGSVSTSLLTNTDYTVLVVR